MMKPSFLFGIVALLIWSCGHNTSGDKNTTTTGNTNVVRVYTHRYYTVDQQLFNQFTANTGIKVEVITDKDEALLSKLKAAAGQPFADIFISSDAYFLEEARKLDILQPFSTEQLDRNLPSRYRDNGGNWVALSRGAMGLAYAKGKVDLSKLNQYSDVASPIWRNQLLLSDPANPSNRGLVAGLISSIGEGATSRLLTEMVKNRVAGISGPTDYDLIKALASGKGSIALVPSGALLQMKASGNTEYTTPANQVGFVFLTNPDRQTVFYISGAGLLRNAPNRAFAIMLLEFLTSAEHQPVYAGATIDFPVNPMSLPHDFIDEIGGFYEIPNTLNEVVGRYEAADVLMKKASWE